jgi:hypothetical protein
MEVLILIGADFAADGTKRVVKYRMGSYEEARNQTSSSGSRAGTVSAWQGPSDGSAAVEVANVAPSLGDMTGLATSYSANDKAINDLAISGHNESGRKTRRVIEIDDTAFYETADDGTWTSSIGSSFGNGLGGGSATIDRYDSSAYCALIHVDARDKSLVAVEVRNKVGELRSITDQAHPPGGVPPPSDVTVTPYGGGAAYVVTRGVVDGETPYSALAPGEWPTIFQYSLDPSKPSREPPTAPVIRAWCYFVNNAEVWRIPDGTAPYVNYIVWIAEDAKIYMGCTSAKEGEWLYCVDVSKLNVSSISGKRNVSGGTQTFPLPVAAGKTIHLSAAKKKGAVSFETKTFPKDLQGAAGADDWLRYVRLLTK